MRFTVFGYGVNLTTYRDAKGVFRVSANLTWVSDGWVCHGARAFSVTLRKPALA